MSISGENLRAERIRRIDELMRLVEGGATEELLEELGALLYAEDRIKEAQDTLYALLKINPQNATALGYIELIRSRLDFVNKDLMNP